MQFEVEQKHPVGDVPALVACLAERGVKLGSPMEQVDQYFAHPSRDFAKTDEALRIRTVGDTSYVTYKGPKLDSATKTRRELELPLNTSDADGSRFAELLSALGFKPVAVVQKTRRPFRIVNKGCEVEGALDDVKGVGTFVELELQSDDAGLAAAQQVVAELAGSLNLPPTERRSYLELLLERRL
jgi:adenylate cyclase class 2